MVIDKEERGSSPSVQFGQPKHLIAEVYRSVVALYYYVKSANKCFTNKFKQMPDGFLFSIAAQRTFSWNS